MYNTFNHHLTKETIINSKLTIVILNHIVILLDKEDPSRLIRVVQRNLARSNVHTSRRPQT